MSYVLAGYTEWGAGIAFCIVLALVVANARRSDRVFTIDGQRYEVYRLDSAARTMEYCLRESADVFSWFAARGTVELFHRDGEIRAVQLRAECSPAGDMYLSAVSESRPATDVERTLFDRSFA